MVAAASCWASLLPRASSIGLNFRCSKLSPRVLCNEQGFVSPERSAPAMDEQQQQRVNEAAEKFANALRESYQTVASRGEAAQQLNAEMTQRFFNTVINHLQRHAEANIQVGEELAGQAQRGQEASRQLTQESVQAYMDFINSMFSYAQAGTQEAQRGAQRAT